MTCSTVHRFVNRELTPSALPALPPQSAADGRVHARYWLETGDDPRRAAEVIAGSLVVSLLAIGSELLFSLIDRRFTHTIGTPEY